MTPPRLVLSAPVEGAAGRRSAALVAAIAARVPCRVLVPGASARDLAPGALTLQEWHDAPGLAELPHLHLLADAPEAAHALHAALLRPGVTVLEDAGLARAHAAMTLDRGLPDAWLGAVAAEHGPAGRRVAAAALHGRAVPWRLLPMLDAVWRRATQLVVRSPGLPGLYLPPPFPAAPAVGRDEARAALGLGGGRKVLALGPLAPALRGAAWLLEGDTPAHLAAADAALALALPLSAACPHRVAAALAAGLPVLAWAGGPFDAWPVSGLGFPADLAQVEAALAALPAAPVAAHQAFARAHGADAAADALLAIVPGCRAGPPAP